VTSPADPRYRIGEAAEAAGVTPRTIRYYEEIGLLGATGDRLKGSHRLYSDADVERLRELVRLRDLLGVSLEELTRLADTMEVRASLRDQWASSTDDTDRVRILEAAVDNIERQLELVHARQRSLAEFATERAAKLADLHRQLAELRG
jgi:DNA-binding transcriptional MerR regulator